MDPPPRLLDPDARPTKPIIIPNGTFKKHTHTHTHTHTLPRRPPPAPDLLYRECLKNHAASLGGHALDGCGEFMPSPTATLTDPTSLKCAACGCHRNFHRRLPDPGDHGESEDEMDGDDEEDDKIEDEEDDKMEDPPAAPPQRRSGSPPAYFSSAPHMLLALRGGPVVNPVGLNPVGGVQKKRFRSKFSPEQKERMQELSERLGWRMQKRDEGVVEEWCKGIGVGKGVFKVWMHNNKHNFVVRRGEVMGSSSSSGGVGVNGGGGGGGGTVVVGNGGGGGGGIHGVVNGSTSSS